MRTENDVGRAVAQWLRLHRIFFYRNNNAPIFQPTRTTGATIIGHYRAAHPDTPKGLADYVAVIEGYILMIETKAPGKGLSKEQKEIQSRVTAAGGFYFKVESLTDLEAGIQIVRRVIRERRLRG
jgi:hypothetical protein